MTCTYAQIVSVFVKRRKSRHKMLSSGPTPRVNDEPEFHSPDKILEDKRLDWLEKIKELILFGIDTLGHIVVKQSIPNVAAAALLEKIQDDLLEEAEGKVIQRTQSVDLAAHVELAKAIEKDIGVASGKILLQGE